MALLTSRRKFLSKLIQAGHLSFTAGLVFFGCGEKKDSGEHKKSGAAAPVESCEDFTTASENDLALRKKLGYVKESPIEDNRCDNCNLFLPPAAGAKCGGCMLFKGPVYPSGYCTYWAPRV
jgi:hypothetical protein